MNFKEKVEKFPLLNDERLENLSGAKKGPLLSIPTVMYSPGTDFTLNDDPPVPHSHAFQGQESFPSLLS